MKKIILVLSLFASTYGFCFMDYGITDLQNIAFEARDHSDECSSGISLWVMDSKQKAKGKSYECFDSFDHDTGAENLRQRYYGKPTSYSPEVQLTGCTKFAGCVGDTIKYLSFEEPTRIFMIVGFTRNSLLVTDLPKEGARVTAIQQIPDYKIIETYNYDLKKFVNLSRCPNCDDIKQVYKIGTRVKIWSRSSTFDRITYDTIGTIVGYFGSKYVVQKDRPDLPPEVYGFPVENEPKAIMPVN